MKPKILIVDDEPELVELLIELIPDGFEGKGFTDPVKAFDSFHKDSDNYALMITDQSMPNLTGVELATKVRAKRPDLPVILLTGFMATKNAYDKKLFNVVLGKPEGVSQLTTEIQKMLN